MHKALILTSTSSFLRDRALIESDLLFVLESVEAGYQEQGYTPISAKEACAVMMRDPNLLFARGETWLAAYSIQEPWYLRDSFFVEEVYGSVTAMPMDLDDFVKVSTSLAKLHGCNKFEFGTRSNKRHAALGKLAERCGARISAITLQKDVT